MQAFLTPSLIALSGGLILASGYTYLAVSATGISTGERTARFLQSGIIAAISIICALTLLSSSTLYNIEAIDSAGDLYIAGSGSSCGQAYVHAVYPANVQIVRCRISAE